MFGGSGEESLSNRATGLEARWMLKQVQHDDPT